VRLYLPQAWTHDLERCHTEVGFQTKPEIALALLDKARCWGVPHCCVVADAELTYTHDGSDTLSDSFTYEVCDSDTSCATATVNITITTNTSPRATDVSSIVEAGRDVEITLEGKDAETCNLIFFTTSDPTSGELSEISDRTCASGSPNSDAAVLTYTHSGSGSTGSDSTSDSFTYRVCDDGTPQECDTGIVNIMITPGVD
jgi:hypothetical protein